MSVTFAPARYTEDPQHGRILEIGSRHEHVCDRPAGDCEDAAIYGPWCCDHADAARDACGCRRFEVNVSNDNAALLLARLGIPFDAECIAGQSQAEDFLGRALVANIGEDDSGDPDVADGGPGTGRALFVDCGHRAGYFTELVSELAELATEAARNGDLVAWA